MEKDPNVRRLSAKELTEEIDAATDLARPRAEVARDLGRVAQIAEHSPRSDRAELITGGALAEERVIASNDEVKQMVAVENGYAEAGNLTPGENVVGGESAIEVKERLTSDRETAKIQSGEGLLEDQQWMHKISVQSGKELAKTVEEKVSQITTAGDFNPAALERVRFGSMLSAIKNDEGYSFGERN